MKTNYNKDNIPLSFRVSLDTHKKYKDLGSLQKKEINYKFNKWLNRILNEV